MFQLKEQDKTSEKELNEMERSNLLDKELKAMVIKVMIYWTQEKNGWMCKKHVHASIIFMIESFLG